MTLIIAIIQAAIPGADKGVIDTIMWGRTPFPCGRVSARQIYKAASTWRRACDNKIQLCDHCDSMALPGDYLCQRCSVSLRAATQQ